jgi:hypothetical protein
LKLVENKFSKIIGLHSRISILRLGCEVNEAGELLAKLRNSNFKVVLASQAVMDQEKIMENLIELTEAELSQIAGGFGQANITVTNTARSSVASAVTTTVRNFSSDSSAFFSAVLTAIAL